LFLKFIEGILILQSHKIIIYSRKETALFFCWFGFRKNPHAGHKPHRVKARRSNTVSFLPKPLEEKKKEKNKKQQEGILRSFKSGKSESGGNYHHPGKIRIFFLPFRLKNFCVHFLN